MAYNYYNNYAAKFNTPEALKESKINQAWFKIERLNNEWRRAQMARRAGNMIQVNYILDGIWLELGSDCSPQQIDTYESLKKEIEVLHMKMASSKRMEEKNQAAYLRNKKIYALWLFLQKMENLQGLGKAYKEERDEDLF